MMKRETLEGYRRVVNKLRLRLRSLP